MPWEPTTRGVSGKGTFCSFTDCKERNEITAFCTTDDVGTRYFCREHWEHIGFFFKLVKECDRCFRAHKADYYRDERTIDTVKYMGKWWELCTKHKKIYDDVVDIILPLDFFD
jgi:hypothetical protein